MAIYIPFTDDDRVGGPQTFMRNLRTYLNKLGYAYSQKAADADGIFFPIVYDKAVLGEFRSSGRKVIQRLDGIYYPSKHGESYGEHNHEIEEIYQNYATHIVFQSEYSRAQCFAMFGEKPESEYDLIINGVNMDIFYPGEVKGLGQTIKFVTSGNFRNLDMLEPVISALDELRQDLKFELHVVGPVTNDKLLPLLAREYVVQHGSQDLEGVSRILRDSDIFIYSHLNPPCPNSVIEAVACGLPVVGFNSGAMSELVNFNLELLADVSAEIFQVYADFDPVKLAEKLLLAVQQFPEFKQRALANNVMYDFVSCAEKYIQVFNS